MLKILFLVFLGASLANDLFIIGDHKILEMGNVLMGIEFTTFTYSYHDYVAIMTSEPVKYENYTFKIIGQGVEVSLMETGEELNNFLHVQLKAAKDGTNVLLSFGPYMVDRFNEVFVFIGKLADKYPKLNFYVLSIIGFDENLYTKHNNNEIKEFNTRLENRIEIAEFRNLKYKSILNKGDPTQIMVNGEPVDILNYASESYLFFKAGYEKIFRAMVEWL